jgi:putative transposase
MVRPLRLEFPGALYHVTARGNERKPIYRNEQDRRRFLERLSAVADGFRLRVHAYVLMRNPGTRHEFRTRGSRQSP